MTGDKFPDKWLNPKVKVVESEIHGRGMIAIEDITEGERIVVWSGDCYTDKEGALKAQAEGKATMQWDDDIFSIETGVMEDIYRVNHSCDPNTWLSDAFTLVAMRDIAAGEEVVVDYVLFLHDTDSGDLECNCGSAVCRGRITDNDWRDPELQERYRGHFTPWLNKLIDGRIGQVP